jgi:mRNA interferase MazF
MKQKEIVLLPYPFTDMEGKKVRPALIVSNDSYNKQSEDCIMVPLTSVMKDEPYSITVEQKDLNSGKLLKTSRIKADKLFSIEKSIVIMKIGSIDDMTFAKVKTEINKIIS